MHFLGWISRSFDNQNGVEKWRVPPNRAYSCCPLVPLETVSTYSASVQPRYDSGIKSWKSLENPRVEKLVLDIRRLGDGTVIMESNFSNWKTNLWRVISKGQIPTMLSNMTKIYSACSSTQLYDISHPSSPPCPTFKCHHILGSSQWDIDRNDMGLYPSRKCPVPGSPS